MTTYEIANNVDAQNYQIECARTVLNQVQGYFSHCDEWQYLPSYAKAIDSLLCVVDSILNEVSPQLKQASTALIEHSNQLKKLSDGR